MRSFGWKRDFKRLTLLDKTLKTFISTPCRLLLIEPQNSVFSASLKDIIAWKCAQRNAEAISPNRISIRWTILEYILIHGTCLWSLQLYTIPSQWRTAKQPLYRSNSSCSYTIYIRISVFKWGIQHYKPFKPHCGDFNSHGSISISLVLPA